MTTVNTFRKSFAAVFGLSLLMLASGASRAQESGVPKPQYTAKGELTLPASWESWVFLGAPLTPHGLNGGKANFPEYHNVYVHPANLSAFRKTGTWPEGTIMLKELQLIAKGSSTNLDGSVQESSGRGYFPGALNGIDISVKDSKRYAQTNGWGFFNFGHHAPPYEKVAAAQPKENCAGCHIANANNMVFDKFYLPVIGRK